MAFTEFIEEFDGGLWQSLIVKNSDEADSSLPSLQGKVDSRIRDKQCLKLPPKWILSWAHHVKVALSIL